MKKLRVALVILLLLTFVAASQMSLAMSAKDIRGSLGTSKSRATLDGIQKKLDAGISDIAKQSELLSAYTKYMAKKTMSNVTRDINASKGNATITKPSTKGMGVPMKGISNAVKALGKADVNLKKPSAIARYLKIPKLSVMK